MKNGSRIGFWASFIVLNPVLMGILFGIVPCYVCPGSGTWCGHRSEPPYFFIQFIIGALIGCFLIARLVINRRKKER